MRLTTARRKPLPGNMVIDARRVLAVVEGTTKYSHRKMQTAELLTDRGWTLTVMDPHREVRGYWLQARGLAICERANDE